MSNPTIREMVIAHLKAHGFDGVYSECGECGCTTDNLFPCGEPGENCQAGYEGPCDCGDCDSHVGSLKESNNENTD